MTEGRQFKFNTTEALDIDTMYGKFQINTFNGSKDSFSKNMRNFKKNFIENLLFLYGRWFLHGCFFNPKICSISVVNFLSTEQVVTGL